MNDELIEKLMDYLEKGQEFIADQAPDFIQQLLKYQWLSNLCGLIISSSIFLISFSVLMYFVFYPKYDQHNNLTFESMIGRVFGGMATLFFLIPITSCIDVLMKISIAPKMFLFEYLTKLKG